MLLLNLPMKEFKDLNIINVMNVQDIFVTNKDYYDKIGGKINLKDLNNYPLFFQKKPSNTREFLDNYSNNVKLIPKMEIVSYNLIMDFLKIGFGIGYATKEFISNELNNKELFELDVIPKIPKRFIGLVTLKQTIPNFSINYLIFQLLKINLKYSYDLYKLFITIKKAL